MDLSYIINQLGEDREEYFNAVSPPVIQTSNFAFRTVAEMAEAFTDEKKYRLYTRGNNPTTEMLAKKIAALEKTDDCLVLSSGASAITLAVLSQVNAGDHVVCVMHPYSWAHHLLTEIMPRFNVETTFVDGTDIRNFEAAIKPNTKVIYLESPTTMYFELQDLTAVNALAKKHGIVTIIDNSYSSPLGQNPAEYGIDIVLHSATKYINGHSDVVGGVLCASNEIIKKIYSSEFLNFGTVAAPWSSWLMIRALRTLPLRIKQSSESTQRIIEFLSHHPKVKKVHYPHHESHPQYQLAKKQMKIPMGMFSIELNTDSKEKVVQFCESLKYFLMAVSWGGHESLIIPAIAFREGSELPFNFIRFYIGLEETEILLNDIKSALELV
ncbi:MAG: PLP-dependent aspartate aminotransferase family protein [Bacteroidota bacterium]